MSWFGFVQGGVDSQGTLWLRNQKLQPNPPMSAQLTNIGHQNGANHPDPTLIRAQGTNVTPEPSDLQAHGALQ